MKKDEIFEEAQSMFLRNKGRKDVIDYLNSNGIIEEEAEDMATKAYLSIKETINQNIAIQEHKSMGGSLGKIAIGILMIGIGVFGLFALERIFYILFIAGFLILGSGIISIFKKPGQAK